VAEDPDLFFEIYGFEPLGPYDGQLSNDGEAVRLVDAIGNPVDHVRYFDGGDWSLWADGRGSSLELIDPFADNSAPAAWGPSDESGKADWEEFRFSVDDYIPSSETELKLYLVERGICLVDDVTISGAGGTNLIPNGGFETTTAPWRIGGTHIRSRRTTEDSASGLASLRIESSGRGDMLVNRIETDTSPRLERGSYDVSLRARWVAGATILVVHSEYHAGPFRRTPCITCGVPEPSLSGNSLAAALELSVPFDLGTPGAENSATRALRLRMGEANAGPVIAAVRHDPPVPEPGETATVTARIVDPDGVARATLYWAPNSAAGGFQAVPLADDGLQGDGEAGDGIYGATLPSFASNARVVFYIEAEDERGAVAVSPREAPERTNLVFSGRLNEDGIDTYRYALDAQRTAELQTRELHSNDLLDGTFVFENEEAYHRVGIRYRGSPWGRPTRASHRVRFPDDHVFRDGLRDINISKTGGATTEGAALFLIGRNARVGQPAPS
ncbi:MAG TPA: choice-of-anchor X domain-containing protein, partial [Planctomycetota bacterium]|nr:choice-of-anchor X domain-containing protein [Planctomycetota bacterium]